VAVPPASAQVVSVGLTVRLKSKDDETATAIAIAYDSPHTYYLVVMRSRSDGRPVWVDENEVTASRIGALKTG
jgi:hypothetical protein